MFSKITTFVSKHREALSSAKSPSAHSTRELGRVSKVCTCLLTGKRGRKEREEGEEEMENEEKKKGGKETRGRR